MGIVPRLWHKGGERYVQFCQRQGRFSRGERGSGSVLLLLLQSTWAGKEQKPSSEASMGNKPKDAMQRLHGSLLYLDKVLWIRVI